MTSNYYSYLGIKNIRISIINARFDLWLHTYTDQLQTINVLNEMFRTYWARDWFEIGSVPD